MRQIFSTSYGCYRLTEKYALKMPNSLSETRLQYCTTQRLGGILEVVSTRKDLRRCLSSLRIAYKLATMFWCDANMTSLPIWLTSANSFLIRPVSFESSDGETAKTQKQGQNNLTSRSNFQIKLGMVSTQHFCYPNMKRKGNVKF